ncbi:cell wall anchor protein, partial [Bacillus pseudomycoides]
MMSTKKTVAISTLALAMITGADTINAEVPDTVKIHDSIKQHAEEKLSELKQAKQNAEERASELKQAKQDAEEKVSE